MYLRPGIFHLGKGEPDLGLAAADILFCLFHIVEINPEIGHHAVDLSFTEPDFPAEIDDGPDVLFQSRFEIFSFVGREYLGIELFLDQVVLAVQDRHLVEQLDDPIEMHIFLDDAILILDIFKQALDADLPPLELGPHTHHTLDGRSHAEDGYHAFPGAFFDLFGNLDLALPTEQGYHTHFPKIHFHRISGLSQRGQKGKNVFALALRPFVRGLLDE